MSFDIEMAPRSPTAKESQIHNEKVLSNIQSNMTKQLSRVLSSSKLLHKKYMTGEPTANEQTSPLGLHENPSGS